MLLKLLVSSERLVLVTVKVIVTVTDNFATHWKLIRFYPSGHEVHLLGLIEQVLHEEIHD
jgi:hypothetical protein